MDVAYIQSQTFYHTFPEESDVTCSSHCSESGPTNSGRGNMDEDDRPPMSKTVTMTRNSLRSFSSNTQEEDPLPCNKTAQSNNQIYSFQSKTELLEIANYVKSSSFAVRQSNRLYSTPPFCSAIHRFHHKRLNIGTILIASPGVIS